ncbi:MAG: formimidoylglutamase [Oligoflexales bacterium]|nr:formimidoylglutamase [Oligoflexales bacterium]
MSLYQDCKPIIWQGRDDGLGAQRVHQLVKVQNLRGSNVSPVSSKTVGLLGFACDEGVSRNLGRRGAALGPEALRRAMASLCVDENIGHNIFDYGTVSCIDENLESSQAALGEKVACLVRNKAHPLIIGGGHETAWGHFLGLLPFLKDKRWGIINFDAHFDLRPLLQEKLGSSGTPFKQIAESCDANKMPFNYLCVSVQRYVNTSSLFQTAEELGVKYILADDIHLGKQDECLEKIRSFYRNLDFLYLSLCLDSFSADLCPGVSAPQARGITYPQFIPLFREILASNKVCSADIVELAPPYDLDHRTAKFAASLALDIIQETKFASLI